MADLNAALFEVVPSLLVGVAAVLASRGGAAGVVSKMLDAGSTEARKLRRMMRRGLRELRGELREVRREVLELRECARAAEQKKPARAGKRRQRGRVQSGAARNLRGVQ